MKVFNCALSVPPCSRVQLRLYCCVWIHTMRLYAWACPHTPCNSLTDNPKKTLSSTPSRRTWSPGDWKHSAVPNDLRKVSLGLGATRVDPLSFLFLHTVITSVFHPFPSPPVLLSLPRVSMKGIKKKPGWGCEGVKKLNLHYHLVCSGVCVKIKGGVK